MARKLEDSVLIEALNIIEEHGSGHKAIAAKATKLPARTLDQRAEQGRLRGLRPTFRKDAPRVYSRQRLGRMHLIIPDCQVRPDVNTDHLEWIANYIIEKRPDVIVNIGDFADMESLSSYDKGKRKAEGKRLDKDIKCASAAMDRLVDPIRACKDYKPEMHLTMGNHEERLARYSNDNPEMEGTIGTHQLRYEDWGWKVLPFLEVVTVDGVSYSHYFTSGAKGLAVSSARSLLNTRHMSCVMGHNQKTDIAFQPVTHQWAIFCGVCNTHREAYLGPQGNHVRRQIVVLHEVEEGRFDPMFVSLRFLQKSYS